MKPNLSVIIPSYNERENVAEAIHRITETLGDNLLEIIVVDDNSPDCTWEVVEQLGEPRCRVMRRMDKHGLASALSDGTRAAQGDIVVWLDCDLGIPPEDIRKLVEALDGYDVAIGSRYVPGGSDTRPRLRALMSYLFNVYTRLLLGRHCWDWTSGFAAVRRSVLLQTPLSDRGHGEYFVEWIHACSRKKIKMTEVPYRYGVRKGGTSKTDGNMWVFLRLSCRYAWRVFRIRLRSD